VPSFTRVQQYSRYELLENRVFVPDLIFHSNQIFLLLVLMRAFVPGGKDRLPTHPVRPYLYRVAASQAAWWRTASQVLMRRPGSAWGAGTVQRPAQGLGVARCLELVRQSDAGRGGTNVARPREMGSRGSRVTTLDKHGNTRARKILPRVAEHNCPEPSRIRI
jgi:hypothetical protein